MGTGVRAQAKELLDHLGGVLTGQGVLTGMGVLTGKNLTVQAM